MVGLKGGKVTVFTVMSDNCTSLPIGKCEIICRKTFIRIHAL